MENPLKKLINKYDYSLKEVGEILGISKQGVYNIINNISKPSYKVIINMLFYFQKDIKPVDLYMYYNYNSDDVHQ